MIKTVKIVVCFLFFYFSTMNVAGQEYSSSDIHQFNQMLTISDSKTKSTISELPSIKYMQDSSSIKNESSHYYVSLGSGVCKNFAADYFRIGSQLKGSYYFSKNILTLKYIYATDINIFGSSSYLEKSNLFVFQYGVNLQVKSFSFTPSVGVSAESGAKHGKILGTTGGLAGTTKYEMIPYAAIGIHAEVQLLSIFSEKGSGIGVSVFSNFNKELYLGGILLTIHLGVGK